MFCELELNKGSYIGLRAISEDDFPQMRKWADDDEITHYMIMGMRPGAGVLFCGWDDLDVEYARFLKSEHDVIFAIDTEFGFIGIIGLYNINWVARNAELRIIIGRPEFLGKGYGTYAIQLLLRYAFDKLNLHRVYLGCNHADARANGCYKKCGFIFEGTSRDYHYRNGRYYDANHYGMLKEEWKKHV